MRRPYESRNGFCVAVPVLHALFPGFPLLRARGGDGDLPFRTVPVKIERLHTALE